MNVLLAEQIVREHTDSAMAEAARARMLREAGRGRKRFGFRRTR